MSETKKITIPKQEDFRRKLLPDEWRHRIASHFVTYCGNHGADTDSQPNAYDSAGQWLADCLAAWCPKYLETKFGADPRLRFSGPERGLLLYGEVGRGKTYLARKIFDFYCGVANKYSGSKKAEFVYDTEFYVGSQVKGNDYLDEFFFGNQRKILFFDDLGNEEESRRYGNIFSGREIIRFRSVCREKFDVPTVITTNLNAKTLAEKYDIYVESRVHSDYKSIFLQYPVDRRKEQWC